MPIGNNTSFSSGPLVFLSPRTKDKNKQKVKPHFIVGRIVNDKIVDTDQTVTNVGGDLIKIEFKSREIKGEPQEEAIFYFRDNKPEPGKAPETYRLPLSFGIAPRSLFNAFASLTAGGNFKDLTVEYYENKRGYDAYSLSQGGNKVDWKYKLEELPASIAITHPMTGKLVKNDYTPINEFFKKELQAIAAKLGGGKGESAVSDKQNTSVAQKETVVAATKSGATKEAPDDGVPF